MSRSLFETVMVVVGFDLGHVLDLSCDLVLLRSPTSFLTSSLAHILTLAITHFESQNLISK